MALRWNKKLVIAYKNAFESPEGKLVLEDLKKRCPTLNRPIGMAKGVDINKLLIQTGQNNVIKHIYIMLGRDPNEQVPAKAVNKIDTPDELL